MQIDMTMKMVGSQTQQPRSMGAFPEQFLDWIRYVLPQGRTLPEDVWQQRHRAILVLLWLHAIGIVGFGVLAGYGWAHGLVEGGVVAGTALLANWPNAGQRLRAAAASVGLVTASAVLVHLSGGFIEMHFHFFVMVIIISLYQDWVPFLLAISFVVLHHGVIGVLDPTAVYNHPSAWADPWKWAAIHAVFLLGASLASVVNWRLSEDTQRQQSEVTLQHSNQELSTWINELERRTEEIRLVNSMGELLQSCLNVEEAYRVIGHSALKLFPVGSGALYMLGASRNLLETVVQWGESSAIAPLFAPHECLALRLGRVHVIQDTQAGLLCQHVTTSGKPPPSYLCIPMMAQGEAWGVLHLRAAVLGPSWSEGSHDPKTHSNQQLAVTVAEQSALALANLKLRESLRQQSIRDPLTGLFNRRYLEETLERELARAERKATALAVIMMDIDHFKLFNDSFGHAAGDAVLRDLGKLLQQHVRGEDIACRYGGEEFALVLPEASLAVARQRAETLRERVQYLHVQHRAQALGAISLSLGVAVFPEHGATHETILHAADEALYRAKRGGHNQVCESSSVEAADHSDLARETPPL
jgi:diguanylate cyclase (GGDEF)-like protein